MAGYFQGVRPLRENIHRQGLVVLAEFAGSAFERGVLIYGGREVLPFSLGGRRFHALLLGMLLGQRLS